MKSVKPIRKKTVLFLFYLCVFCLATPTTVSANGNISDTPFEISVGLGIQYSGPIGTQFNFISDRNKFYLSAGAGGIGAGYDFAFARNLSVGANYTRFFLVFATADFASVNINYHFNSHFKRGWVLGLDVIWLRSVTLFGTIDSEGGSSRVQPFISVGYRF